MGSWESGSLINLYRVIVLSQSFAATTHGFMGNRQFDISPQSNCTVHQLFATTAQGVMGKRKLIDLHRVIVIHQSFATTAQGVMGKRKLIDLHRVIVIHQSFATTAQGVMGKRKIDRYPQSHCNTSVICNHGPRGHGKAEN